MSEVSIIVTVYNGEQYISRCIDMLIAQTMKDIEIIIVNDGSYDNTKKIIEKYSKEDSRIKVLDLGKNKGSYEARLLGFELSTGNYIAYCDVDDFYDRKAIELMYKKCIRTGADIVQCKTISILDGNKKTEEKHVAHIRKKDLYGKHIFEVLLEDWRNGAMWSKLIRRDTFLRAFSEYPRNIHIINLEDFLTFLFIAYYSKKHVFIKNCHYYYNRTNENASGTFGNLNKDIKRIEDILKVSKYIESFLESKNILKEYINLHLKNVAGYLFWAFNNFQYTTEINSYIFQKFIDYKDEIIAYIPSYIAIESFNNVNFSNIIFKNKNKKGVKNIGIICNNNLDLFNELNKLRDIEKFQYILFLDKPINNKHLEYKILPYDLNERYYSLRENIYKYDIDMIIYDSKLHETLPYDALFIKTLGIVLITFEYNILEKNKNTFSLLKNINFYTLSDTIIVYNDFDLSLLKMINVKKVKNMKSILSVEDLNKKDEYDSKIIDNRFIIYKLTETLSRCNDNWNLNNEEYLPYFFSIIIDSKYTTIRIFGIKITLKSKRYYDKPMVISLSSILRNLFSIRAEKEYLILRLLFIKFSFRRSGKNL